MIGTACCVEMGASMALEFSEIYRAELEQVRQRRLHQWSSEQGTPSDDDAAREEGTPPPFDLAAHITEGVPDDAQPTDGKITDPLVFNKILERMRETAGGTASDRPGTGRAHHGLVGLALSGGGVRSAAFCLGAIQALDRWGVFKKFDYLSTVSGGGFTGACLSSLYAKGDPSFPFRHSYGVPEGPVLRHLRNYSNYLAPRGIMDYLKAPGLLLRGILANLMIILPYVFLAAILTVWFAGPTIRSAVYTNLPWDTEVTIEHRAGVAQLTFFDSRHDRLSLTLTDLLTSWGYSAPVVISGLPPDARVMPPGAIKVAEGAWRLSRRQIESFALDLPQDAVTHFNATLRMVGEFDDDPTAPRFNVWKEFIVATYIAIGVLAAVLLVYPFLQTVGHKFGFSTWGSRDLGNSLLAILFGVTALVAFVELQPIATYYFTYLWLTDTLPLIDTFTGLLTAIAGLLAAYSGRIAKRVNKLSGTLLLIGIGLFGPLVFWLIYLMMNRWAICGPPRWTKPPQWAEPPEWIKPLSEVFAAWPAQRELCNQPTLVDVAAASSQAVVAAYGILAGAIVVYALIFINVNRTSLHGYYRDRLSKAYLFDRPRRRNSAPDSTEELAHNDRQLLHELRGKPRGFKLARRLVGVGKRLVESRLNVFTAQTWADIGKILSGREEGVPKGLFVGPYHLINATINIQKPEIHAAEGKDGSDEVKVRSHDLRGRKADYFLFSQLHVGSRITGYCSSEEMHEEDRHLDLGTAMAISGAAAAPNMGTSTVKPLVFIMTMMNVRLGYWLPNPRFVHFRHNPDANRNSGATVKPRLIQKLRKDGKRLVNFLRLATRVGPLYLLLELFGNLNETWAFVNVSDGGHIENLGLYPLLVRRCRLIIAVDGERDPKVKERHKFSALASAIRHAKIDEGIDINIDLRQIGEEDGKHFAVGEIDYGPDFPSGWLVYIKSSLTQDENPYIREYQLKNPDFPHESTGDQFFNETQFECYRALGYHAAQDFLERSGSDGSSDRNLKKLFKGNKKKRGKSRLARGTSAS